MKTKILLIALLVLFLGGIANAECDINPQELYKWQPLKQGMMNLNNIVLLAVKLKNPDENAKVKEVLIFADLPTGIIVAFQYEIDGIKRTFVLRGDKYIEYLGKNKHLL